MSTEADIDIIVELLKHDPVQTLQERFTEAYERLESFLDGPPKDRLSLLMAMIDADVHGTTLGGELVSFIDEADLVVVAGRLLSNPPGREEDEYTLDHLAMQQPELLRPEHLTISDFREWHINFDPLAPPPAHHIIFQEGSPQGSIFVTCRRQGYSHRRFPACSPTTV